VAILGAGAAGLMTAARLNETTDLKVCVIEGNGSAGAKIRISGGGKCNLTNTEVSENNYLGSPELVREVLRRFDETALLAWVRERGCEPVLRKGRYWFCPESARQLLEIFRRETKRSRFFYRHRIGRVEAEADGYAVETDRGTFHARRVVVATGGASFASVGATDVGLKIAEGFGIETVPFRPALAGLTLQKEQFWMKELSGISLPVTILAGGRTLREDLLFAHRGISGPAVLSASLYWEKGTVSVDFLDGKPVRQLLERGGNRKVSTALPLPKRFVTAFLEQAGVRDAPCRGLRAEERDAVAALNDYVFAPAGTFGFSKAEVSKGGVACGELAVPSCESRAYPGLYFVGEVTDVTGELGGYNFQWAFASARAAADALAGRCE